ncbi:MAG: hypothetical protein KY468_01595 [Armatimonadetes bacterium]|nr:hypothetical protein [Armatimonadota bacterium]
MSELFREMPKVDPPANFRAQVLARVSEPQPARLWLGQWSLPTRARRLLAGAMAAVAAALLFTQALDIDVITAGPNVSVPMPAIETPIRAASDTQPDVLFSGSGAPLNPLKETVKLHLILQPKEAFSRGKVVLADMTQGLACETEGVTTERGKVLWQGTIQSEDTVALPLEFRATQPAVHRVLFQIESEGQNYRRMLFIPAFSEPKRMTTDVLRGNWSVSDTMTGLARHFGVVMVTDLTRQRPQHTQIRLSLPGRAVAQVAAQRNLQWKVSNGVYNLYEPGSDSPVSGPGD